VYVDADAVSLTQIVQKILTDATSNTATTAHNRLRIVRRTGRPCAPP